MILQRDQQTFEQAQRRKRHDQNQRQPQQRVQPIRRLKEHLGDQGGENDDTATDQDDEDRRPVARICKAVVKPAALAGRTQRQEALEKMPFAAARATPAQAAADRQILRRCLTGHEVTKPSKQKGGVMTPPFLQKCPRYPACGAPEPHTYMQANRNSHTTSTKCQYQAANSKPRCCLGVKWPAKARSRQTIRKIEPIITCAP